MAATVALALACACLLTGPAASMTRCTVADQSGCTSAEMIAASLQESGEPTLVPLRRETISARLEDGTISKECSYVGTMAVGGKGDRQEFRVAFDTGSGQTVLIDGACRSPACAGKRRFNVSASETARRVTANGARVLRGLGKQRVEISYGGWGVDGAIVQDALCVRGPGLSSGEGGTRCVEVSFVSSLEVTGQAPFGVADYDGVVGIGLGGLSVNPLFSYLGRLSEQGRVVAPRFAVYLGGEASEIAIGGHNPARVREPLSWVSVAEPELGFWQVKIQAVRVGNSTLKACGADGCRGIVDTGSAHIGVPAAQLGDLSGLLASSASGDCRRAVAPIIHIDLSSGFSLNLGPADYMNELPLPLAAGDSSEGTCFAKLAASAELPEGMGPSVFVLGEPVLQRYYSVYDWRRKEIGFGLSSSPLAEKAKSIADTEETIFLLQVTLLLD